MMVSEGFKFDDAGPICNQYVLEIVRIGDTGECVDFYSSMQQDLRIFPVTLTREEGL
jgi:hypothetical protein